MALLCSISQLSFGQGSQQLSVAPPAKLTAKSGSAAAVRLSVELRSGFHANSNTPSDEYMIPMRLSWGSGPLEVAAVVYPKPQFEKYAFSDKPLSVYSGAFEILTRFRVSSAAVPGLIVASAKLRYQACNDRMCFPPRTVDISVPVEIVK